MKALIVLLVLALTACLDQGPYDGLIEGKTPYPNPESIRVKWNAMEACSGVHRNFEDITFYTATSITDDKGTHGGVFIKERNEIIVSHRIFEDQPHSRIMDHEIMHALLNHGGHPRLFFKGLCGDLIHAWVD